MPKISIIIPIYNVEKYLNNCLNSIQNQTFKDFECIMINDGSTDNSIQICNKYVQLDKRYILINKKNTGVSDSRNIGLNISTGEFILFIDGDDYIHPQMISILYNKLIVHPECSFSMIREEIVSSDIKQFKLYNETDINYLIIPQFELVKSLYNRSNVISELTSVVVWNKLYRKSAINNIRFIKTGTEDTEFNNKIIMNNESALYINIPLYFLMERVDSITNQPYGNRNIDRINSYYHCLNNIPIDKTYYRSLCLEKLYKTILNVRYNTQSTSFRNKAKNTIQEIIDKTISDFSHSNHLKWPRKHFLLLFLYTPFLYSLFIKTNELIYTYFRKKND